MNFISLSADRRAVKRRLIQRNASTKLSKPLRLAWGHTFLIAVQGQWGNTPTSGRVRRAVWM